MNNELLRKLQLTELEILKDLHFFCIENGIQYSLDFGTLLGAVRHGGFIPWDDDLDIAMTRENYNKFISYWSKNPLKGYYMDSFLFNNNCCISHIKIRKDNTKLLTVGESDEKGHHGIWIDIFVRDKMENSKKAYKHMKRQAVKMIVATRGNQILKSESFPSKFVKYTFKMIPICIRKKIFLSADKQLQKYSNLTDNYSWVCTSTVQDIDQMAQQKCFSDYSEIMFEDFNAMTLKEYELMLVAEYGNYMELPPLEEQVCTHNPIKIVF